MPAVPESQSPKLLEEVRQVLPLHNYCIHTERSYIAWIVRFANYHDMYSGKELFPPEAKIEALLTHLAAN